MLALSLHQPWASLIALGVKTIETRPWPIPPKHIGKRVAIHSTLRASPIDIGGWRFRMNRLPRYEWVLYRRVENVHRWTDIKDYAVTPLGCIVATATLADCLPIVKGHPEGPFHGICVYEDGTIAHNWWGADNGGGRQGGGAHYVNPANPQHLYGDYTPGRFAWMLEDIEPLPEPIPARGRQRLWNWEPA